jgi:hypothetical protein
MHRFGTVSDPVPLNEMALLPTTIVVKVACIPSQHLMVTLPQNLLSDNIIAYLLLLRWELILILRLMIDMVHIFLRSVA